ncbi:MAG: 4'-phosphopantetheinyl transferase superfamily protein [Isosphaeraceae bacterium]
MSTLDDPDEVHVWRFRLDVASGELAQLNATLHPAERERAARFRTGTLRDRFVAGRGRLREILATYLGCTPGELDFSYGPQGKPALHPACGLEFNLSHSADVAILGVTRGTPLGVDVERVDPLRDVQGILDRFFATGEQAEFHTRPDDDPHLRFYRGWARKEAFLKALGTGLSTPLDSFEVSLDSSSPQILRVGDDPAEAERWSLRDLDAGPGFAAAAVVRGPISRIVYRDCGGGVCF